MLFALKAIAILASVTAVLAGPGASVNACIELKKKPFKPFSVTFNPDSGNNKCMESIGSPRTVTVTSAGVTCGYIGYVEAKVSSSGGDFCATDESIYTISYNAQNGKSGSITSRWRKQWGSQTNEISFYEHAPGSMVCGQPSLCYSEKFTWPTGSQGPAYFIFRPEEQHFSGDSEQVALQADHQLFVQELK